MTTKLSREFSIACIEKGYHSIRHNWNMWLLEDERRLCRLGDNFSFRVSKDNQRISVSALTGICYRTGRMNNFVFKHKYHPKWKIIGSAGSKEYNDIEFHSDVMVKGATFYLDITFTLQLNNFCEAS